MSIVPKNAASSTSKEMKKVTCADHAILAWTEMRHHYENKQLFDVVIIAGVDQKRVSAHRLVLSACSPYFSAMFTGSLCEATAKEVTLNEVQGDILQALVKFCYTGCIELHHDTVEILLATASLFQIKSIVTECTYYLEDQLDPSNSLGIGFFAELHECKYLQKKAEAYTRQEFAQVCKNVEFFQLSVTQLAELIASDEVNVATEEVVFNSVMEWVNSCDLSKRTQHIRELLPLVRMTQLSPSFMDNHVEAVCRSNECLHLYNNALKWHSMPEKQKQMATVYTKARNSTSGTLFAIGAFASDKKIYIDRYCPRTDEWTIWNNITDNRYDFSVTTMDHNLLIVGGQNEYNTRKALNSVVNMNLSTLAVTELKSMSTPRSRLCVAVVDNTLYAIGGENDSGMLNTVERWDPVKCTWNFVAPMPTHRWGAGAAVLNGCIYVVGGCGYRLQCTVECYNPRYNTWTEHAPMSVARHSFGIAASNGFLYAVGGVTSNHSDGVSFESTAERYDPVADKWTMIESMNVTRNLLGCSFLGKCLMAVGGYGSGLVEGYDPETGKWSKKGFLNLHSTAASFVVPTRYVSNVSHPLE